MTAASKIVFDENKTAMGVQYISRITNKTSGARVRKEVILAAGAIRSPQILQVSGVGSKAVTDVLGVQSVVDLPGVGVNLQDHPTIYLAHNCLCIGMAIRERSQLTRHKYQLATPSLLTWKS